MYNTRRRTKTSVYEPFNLLLEELDLSPIRHPISFKTCNTEPLQTICELIASHLQGNLEEVLNSLIRREHSGASIVIDMSSGGKQKAFNARSSIELLNLRDI